MTIWSVTFWKACAERALATFAQTLGAVIGVDLIGIHVIDWPTVLAIAATAALLSVLKSVAVGATTDGSPAIGGTEVLPARRAYTPDDGHSD